MAGDVGPGGIIDVTGVSEVFGAPKLGIWPKGKQVAQPTIDPTNPFYSGTQGEFNPKTAQGYGPPASATNLLVQQALQRLGIGLTGHLDQPMYASPYAGRASALSDALSQMTAQSSASTPYGGGRSAQATQSAVSGQAYPLQSALTMAEPARRSQLLDLLLAAYGLDASMFGGYVQGQTGARNIRTQKAAAKDAALGQIPIVGGLLAGF